MLRLIVESSYLVEDEVSWIAINSNQVVNGTIVWRNGLPENEKTQQLPGTHKFRRVAHCNLPLRDGQVPKRSNESFH